MLRSITPAFSPSPAASSKISDKNLLAPRPALSRQLQQLLHTIQTPTHWDKQADLFIPLIVVRLPQWPHERTLSILNGQGKEARRACSPKGNNQLPPIQLIQQGEYYATLVNGGKDIIPTSADGDSFLNALITGLKEQRSALKEEEWLSTLTADRLRLLVANHICTEFDEVERLVNILDHLLPTTPLPHSSASHFSLTTPPRFSSPSYSDHEKQNNERFDEPPNETLNKPISTSIISPEAGALHKTFPVQKNQIDWGNSIQNQQPRNAVVLPKLKQLEPSVSSSAPSLSLPHTVSQPSDPTIVPSIYATPSRLPPSKNVTMQLINDYTAWYFELPAAIKNNSTHYLKEKTLFLQKRNTTVPEFNYYAKKNGAKTFPGMQLREKLQGHIFNSITLQLLEDCQFHIKNHHESGKSPLEEFAKKNNLFMEDLEKLCTREGKLTFYGKQAKKLQQGKTFQPITPAIIDKCLSLHPLTENSSLLENAGIQDFCIQENILLERLEYHLLAHKLLKDDKNLLARYTKTFMTVPSSFSSINSGINYVTLAPTGGRTIAPPSITCTLNQTVQSLPNHANLPSIYATPSGTLSSKNITLQLLNDYKFWCYKLPKETRRNPALFEKEKKLFLQKHDIAWHELRRYIMQNASRTPVGIQLEIKLSGHSFNSITLDLLEECQRYIKGTFGNGVSLLHQFAQKNNLFIEDLEKLCTREGSLTFCGKQAEELHHGKIFQPITAAIIDKYLSLYASTENSSLLENVDIHGFCTQENILLEQLEYSLLTHQLLKDDNNLLSRYAEAAAARSLSSSTDALPPPPVDATSLTPRPLDTIRALSNEISTPGQPSDLLTKRPRYQSHNPGYPNHPTFDNSHASTSGRLYFPNQMAVLTSTTSTLLELTTQNKQASASQNVYPHSSSYPPPYIDLTLSPVTEAEPLFKHWPADSPSTTITSSSKEGNFDLLMKLSPHTSATASASYDPFSSNPSSLLSDNQPSTSHDENIENLERCIFEAYAIANEAGKHPCADAVSFLMSPIDAASTLSPTLTNAEFSSISSLLEIDHPLRTPNLTLSASPVFLNMEQPETSVYFPPDGSSLRTVPFDETLLSLSHENPGQKHAVPRVVPNVYQKEGRGVDPRATQYLNCSLNNEMASYSLSSAKSQHVPQFITQQNPMTFANMIENPLPPSSNQPNELAPPISTWRQIAAADFVFAENILNAVSEEPVFIPPQESDPFSN